MSQHDDLVYYSTADSKVEALRIGTAKPVWGFDAKKGALSRIVPHLDEGAASVE